jgi:hypothetical protein
MAGYHYDNKATLTIFDFTSWSYRAEIAEFGNQMEDELVYHAITLMIPPTNYSQLCEIPYPLSEEALRKQKNYDTDDQTTTTTTTTTESESESITQQPSLSSSSFETWNFSGPVALLVSLGGCSPMTKALVAFDIHNRISKDLKYVVFYNNDPNDFNTIEPLNLLYYNVPTPMIDDIIAPNSNTSDETNWNEDLQRLLDDSMVFVSVSTGTGTAIMGRMERLKATTGASPEFQDPKIIEEEFGRWHFVCSFFI